MAADGDQRCGSIIPVRGDRHSGARVGDAISSPQDGVEVQEEQDVLANKAYTLRESCSIPVRLLAGQYAWYGMVLGRHQRLETLKQVRVVGTSSRRPLPHPPSHHPPSHHPCALNRCFFQRKLGRG